MAVQNVYAKSVIRERMVKCNLLQYARDNRDEGFFNDITITTGKNSSLLIAWFYRVIQNTLRQCSKPI